MKIFATVVLVFVILVVGLFFATQRESPAKQTTKTEISEPAEIEPKLSIVSTQEPISTKLRRPTVELPDLDDIVAGDNLSFYIPHEDLQYSGVVETVTTNTSGSKSVSGNFFVNGTGFRFVFTVGTQYTFGTLHTPEGRYQLESDGETGTLVSTAEVIQQRDFTKPDYVIPKPVRPPKS